MSDEEAAAHRAPGTIVQNSAVFCDRSARCAAASRPFSPRGLLWLFLRKKEQEKFANEVCEASCPVLAQAKAGNNFLRTFGLTQKYQKVKHGEKSRVSLPAVRPMPCAGPICSAISCDCGAVFRGTFRRRRRFFPPLGCMAADLRYLCGRRLRRAVLRPSSGAKFGSVRQVHSEPAKTVRS